MSGGVLTFAMPPPRCQCDCHTDLRCGDGFCCACHQWREPPPSHTPRIEGTEFIVRRKSDYVTTDTKDNK